MFLPVEFSFVTLTLCGISTILSTLGGTHNKLCKNKCSYQIIQNKCLYVNIRITIYREKKIKKSIYCENHNKSYGKKMHKGKVGEYASICEALGVQVGRFIRRKEGEE